MCLLSEGMNVLVGMFPDSLPLQMLWQLAVSPGSLVTGPRTPGTVGPAQTWVRMLKFAPLPSSLPSLPPHLAPRDSPPGPQGPQVFHKDGSGKGDWENKAVICVTGPAWPCESPESACRQAMGPHDMREA